MGQWLDFYGMNWPTFHSSTQKKHCTCSWHFSVVTGAPGCDDGLIWVTTRALRTFGLLAIIFLVRWLFYMSCTYAIPEPRHIS